MILMMIVRWLMFQPVATGAVAPLHTSFQYSCFIPQCASNTDMPSTTACCLGCTQSGAHAVALYFNNRDVMTIW
jgi:hypothetical protein